MNRQLKNTFTCMAALIGICGISANVSTAKDFSSYYDGEVISAEKFNAVTKALDEGVKHFGAQNGILVVMNPVDATILASYTTNKSSTANKELYEAGSIMKTFDVAMGLESGKIKDDEEIDTSKPLVIDGFTIKDRNEPYGIISPEEVLVKSSNIGAAKIALKTGGEYQYDFFNKLGMLSKIDSYEIESAKPMFFGKEKWISTPKYIATASYGYGISETPLHLITAYSALINGGIYHKPSFEKINDKEGVRVISEDNSMLMRKYLRKVVTDGTAKRADSDKYYLMGKTGTADKIKKDGKYDSESAITTFVGNFEHDGVSYAILVILDDPQASKETYGFKTAGWNAVPVTKNIIEELIK